MKSMREWTKSSLSSWGSTWSNAWSSTTTKQRALAVTTALAVSFLAVVGGALLASWAPIAELAVLLGVPSSAVPWLLPLSGATLLGLAALLTVDEAAFYAATGAAVLTGAIALAALQGGIALAVAVVPLIVLALTCAVMLLRATWPDEVPQRAPLSTRDFARPH